MDTGSSAGARPLVVTEDQDLLEQVLRLCAAAGVTPDVVETVDRTRQFWARASAVLVGDDAAGAVAGLGLTRRDDVVLVSGARDETPLWRLAVRLHADDVMMLPGAQLRLSQRISDLADGPLRGTILAVLPGSGGAGASTVAAGLALTAAKQGLRTLLIDGDPLGGGIELLVGCEDAPGLRWAEVAATQGRVGAAALRAALPAVGELAVLSFDRTGPASNDSHAMLSMLGSAQRGSELVVVDLARRLDEASTDVVMSTELLVLVATPDVRGVAGAQRVLADLRPLCSDIRLLVRRRPGSDLTAQTVAETLGLPLVASIATRRSLSRAVNDGLGPLGRGGLERPCRTLLDALPLCGASR